MPKLVAMLRVKDGILFVRQWLENISKLVDEIVVVDNGSTDGTLGVLQKHPKVVAIERTEGFHEGRDKILAYQLARERKPDWVIWLDVDEIFEDRLSRRKLEKLMSSKLITRYFFRRFHFHNDLQHFEARLDKLIHISRPDRVLWKEQPNAFFSDAWIHNGLIRNVKGIPWVSNLRIKHIRGASRDYTRKKYDEVIRLDPDHAKMYLEHRDQVLPTLRWYEYDEAPFLVKTQNLLLWVLFTISFIRQLASDFFRGSKTNRPNVSSKNTPDGVG